MDLDISVKLGMTTENLTPAQGLAFAKLENYCNIVSNFERLAAPGEADADWDKLMDRLRLNYVGEEVHLAQTVTWEQLAPALPAEGKGGTLKLAGNRTVET